MGGPVSPLCPSRPLCFKDASYPALGMAAFHEVPPFEINGGTIGIGLESPSILLTFAVAVC